MQLSCSSGITFLPYSIDHSGVVYLTETVAPRMSIVPDGGAHHAEGPSLARRLKTLLSDVDKENVYVFCFDCTSETCRVLLFLTAECHKYLF